MSRKRAWPSGRGPSPYPLSPLPGPPACQQWGLIAFLLLSIQGAAGPGHRDGVGHRHVLPFPASEVHEDRLAAAGEVAAGGGVAGAWPKRGPVNWGHRRGQLGCRVSAWMWKLSWPQVSESVSAAVCMCVNVCVHGPGLMDSRGCGSPGEHFGPGV